MRVFMRGMLDGLMEFGRGVLYGAGVGALIVVVMAMLGCAASGAAELGAPGDLVRVRENVEVRLKQAACDNAKVLENIEDAHHSRFKMATITFDRQILFACWIDIGDAEFFYMMLETGQAVRFTREGFSLGI